MILANDIENPDPPRCFNREPFKGGWFEDRCATWSGTGIGQPTPEYPSGTPYPIAHGWLPWCRVCRWMPEGVAA